MMHTEKCPGHVNNLKIAISHLDKRKKNIISIKSRGRSKSTGQ